MLTRALRHEPGDFGIELDAHGWAEVGPLVRAMSGKVEFSREILEYIVATDPKGRYEFDVHHMRVRARQGHSVPVDVESAVTAVMPSWDFFSKREHALIQNSLHRLISVFESIGGMGKPRHCRGLLPCSGISILCVRRMPTCHLRISPRRRTP